MNARIIAKPVALALFALAVTTGLSAEAGKTLTWGFAPGPYSELFAKGIKPGLEKKGYKVVVKEFTDYVQPDLALGNKSIDVNLYQHSVYLADFATKHDLALSPVISVPTAGIGIYSKKIKSLNELKKGDVVTLSNDPTNLARGLRFLVKLNLITLKKDVSPLTASEKDIDGNPKGLVFKTLEAAQLPRTLDSATASLVNGNYALASGLKLSEAIVLEQLDENIKNVIAVRTEDLGAQWVKDIKEIVESPEFAAVIDNPQNIFVGFQKPQWLTEKQKAAKK